MTASQIRLLRALTPNWPDTPQDRAYDFMEEKWVDPRDPDPSREGIFQYHNCYRCEHGKKPCVSKEPVCPYPHARND